jgi:hypothetical protein
MNRWSSTGAVVACGAVALGACQPKFEGGGSLSIDGQTFQPVACRVFPNKTGQLGIELLNAEGARLELKLPKAFMRAGSEVTATPVVRYTPAGSSAASLGECGSLTLRGGGYHVDSHRAASGKVSLACAGTPPITGEFTFDGCY